MGTLRRVHGTDRWWIDPESGVFYLEVYVGNERTRLSSKERDLEKAKKKRRFLEREAKLRYGRRKPTGRPFFAPEWDGWTMMNRSIWKPGTYADIVSRGRVHLKPFFGDYLVDEINDAVWEKYLSFKLSERPGLKIAKHQDYLAMFLRHQQRLGNVHHIPTLRNPDPETDAARIITPEEEREILAKLTGDMRLAFLMAIRLGMREYEVLGLQKDRISTQDWFIRLKASDTKTERGRSVPVADTELREEILKRMSDPSPFLFPSPKDPSTSRWMPRKEWDAVREDTGIDITFHNTRHTCATRMADVMPVTHTARILGQSIEVCDKRYYRCKESDLMASMEKLRWETKW